MSAARFSIASLFLLTMVVAIVVGAVAQSVRGEEPNVAVIAAITYFGLLLGASAGIIVALTRFRWPLAIGIGLPMGAVIGWVVVVLTFMPKGLPVLLAGCPLVVLFGAAVRFLSRRKD
jgi:predicted lysophospholipase L1 biosynthesis ABC-type transport system permease subunit